MSSRIPTPHINAPAGAFAETVLMPGDPLRAAFIAEQYLEGDPEFGLIDYKLFMFNGQFKFILVCSNRFMDGGMKQSFYDIGWRKMDVAQTEEISETREIEKPKDFQRMIECAEKLSVDMPFVRVDFIVSRDKLYFSELTYFESGGRKPVADFSFFPGDKRILPGGIRTGYVEGGPGLEEGDTPGRNLVVVVGHGSNIQHFCRSGIDFFCFDKNCQIRGLPLPKNRALCVPQKKSGNLPLPHIAARPI